ncbi:ferritin family protein [Candidatus Desantisbacteria bacterium]|nr:ferritin family protein [Candidatus Desantisbacteria bacterium]
MAANFAGSEIVELGIQIEKNGRDFYNILAGKANNKKITQTFIYLAKEEDGHIKVFNDLLNSVSKYEPVEAYPEEYFAYMHILADEYVFIQNNKGTELAQKINTITDAIKMAIEFEKDSILFFEGMKKLVNQKDQKIIEDLISQEQNHLRQLSAIKNIT